MKTLKFSPPLPDMILSGEKYRTWRINDDKDICVGDILSFLARPQLNEFTKAKVLEAKLTTFGQLTPKDWEGHEKFESEEEMKGIYKKFYGIDISKNTQLKVIKFKLI